MENVYIRSAKPQDLNFINHSWLKSYRNLPPVTSIPNYVYWPKQTPIVAGLIERSQVLVLADGQDHDHIVGYVVYERKCDVCIVHYVYIKQTYRRLGLAQLLLNSVRAPLPPETPVLTTHWLKPCLFGHILKSVPLVYNPYLIGGVK